MLIKEDFEIKNYTSFKIGGKIKKVYFPETIEEFAQILKDEPNIFVGGNWSNTLVSSYGYAYSVVSTSKLDKIEEQMADSRSALLCRQEDLMSGWQSRPTDTKNLEDRKVGRLEGKLVNENSLSELLQYPQPDTVLSPYRPIALSPTIITASAGVKGPKLSQTVAEYGLSGLEFMIGFPGSVGGEVFMNAGAHGQSISDVLKSAKVFDGEKIITLTKDEMEFSYRHSICQDKNYIVLEAEFELTPDNPDKIKQKMAENLEFRKNHQPSLSLPNCGSIFRNPENNSAGKLLDECGVKGLQIGGAKVWQNHANFIVNTGNATSTDVLQLMLEMQNRVKEKFNIELIPEIKFLGNNKNEVELCEKLKIK